MKKTKKVPRILKGKYDEIMDIIKVVCDKYLNEEYYEMSEYLCAALSRKRPSPIEKGRVTTWACGVVHALGYVNFLFDPELEPFITAGELYEIFGVSSSTGAKKSRKIRELMKIEQLDPDWTLPSMVENNPLIWTVEYDGMLIDVRKAPRHIQERAYADGFIPYIPDDINKDIDQSFDKDTYESEFDNVIPFPRGNKRESKMSKETLIQKAEEMVYQIEDLPDRRIRIQKLNEIIDMCSECTSAYISMGYQYTDLIDQKKWFDKAVKSGERYLGDKFHELKGHFWGFHETRPYMIAKYNLADIEWCLGNNKIAIEHLKEMLILNEMDNQGVRYTLFSWLIVAGNNKDNEELIEKYDGDISAAYNYNKALYYFKSNQLSKAKNALEEAVKRNKFIPPYLIGKKRLPKEPPMYMGLGDKLEAEGYVFANHQLWKYIDGAIEWLRGKVK